MRQPKAELSALYVNHEAGRVRERERREARAVPQAQAPVDGALEVADLSRLLERRGSGLEFVAGTSCRRDERCF
jgi:hypothetical protein